MGVEHTFKKICKTLWGAIAPSFSSILFESVKYTNWKNIRIPLPTWLFVVKMELRLTCKILLRPSMLIVMVELLSLVAIIYIAWDLTDNRWMPHIICQSQITIIKWDTSDRHVHCNSNTYVASAHGISAPMALELLIPLQTLGPKGNSPMGK